MTESAITILPAPGAMKPYAVSTQFMAACRRRWWEADIVICPHRIKVLPAPDFQTAEAIAVADDAQYWRDKFGIHYLKSIKLLSVVTVELETP